MIRQVFITLISILFTLGCFDNRQPRTDYVITAGYLKDYGNDYYLFYGLGGINRLEPYFGIDSDTITIDGQEYKDIFIAKIDPSNLKKNYSSKAPFKVGNYVILYVNAPGVREIFPSENSRNLLILENVVGTI